jgi:hypothetical protein
MTLPIIGVVFGIRIFHGHHDPALVPDTNCHCRLKQSFMSRRPIELNTYRFAIA